MRSQLSTLFGSPHEDQPWLDRIILSFREMTKDPQKDYSDSENHYPLLYMMKDNDSTRGLCGIIAAYFLERRRIEHLHFDASTLSGDRSKCIIRKGNELISTYAVPSDPGIEDRGTNSSITFIGEHGQAK